MRGIKELVIARSQSAEVPKYRVSKYPKYPSTQVSPQLFILRQWACVFHAVRSSNLSSFFTSRLLDLFFLLYTADALLTAARFDPACPATLDGASSRPT